MIHLTQIQFGYNKKKPLFTDLSLHLKPGHICGLLGKNGAGKSTLLKIISGLRFTQQGMVEVLNRNATLRDAEILQELYYLEEEPYIPHLKIKQYEKAYASFYPHFNHEQFQELLAAFEIENSNAYMDFNFNQTEYHELVIRDIAPVYFGFADTFEALSGVLSSLLGRQPLLPDWVYDGTILGVQGGTETMLKRFCYRELIQ